MSNTKEVLGHIDCPACGAARGMRVTEDKNGNPFGYCEHTCGQQLRVGPDPYRVKKFRERYPWAASKAKAAPVAEPVPVTEPKPAAKPVTVTEQRQEVRKASPMSALSDAVRLLSGQP